MAVISIKLEVDDSGAAKITHFKSEVAGIKPPSPAVAAGFASLKDQIVEVTGATKRMAASFGALGSSGAQVNSMLAQNRAAIRSGFDLSALARSGQDANKMLAGMRYEVGVLAPPLRVARQHAIAFKDGLLEVTGVMQKMARVWVSVQVIIAAVIAAMGINKIIEAVDAWQTLSARLRLVTASASEAANAQKILFALAQDIRVPLADAAELYVRIGVAMKGMGLSQQEMADLTRVVAESIQLSGASAQEAASSVRQFTQALARGKVDMTELGPLLENAPPLVQALAEGLKKISPEFVKLTESGKSSIGALLEMSKKGTLSSELFMRALLTQSGAVHEQFKQLPLTVSQATTQIGNEFLRMAGTLSTSGIVFELGKIRQLLSDPVTGDPIRDSLQGILDVVAKLVGLLPVLIGLFQTLADIAKPIDAGFRIAGQGIFQFMKILEAAGGGAGKASYLFSKGDFSGAKEAVKSALSDMEKAVHDFNTTFALEGEKTEAALKRLVGQETVEKVVVGVKDIKWAFKQLEKDLMTVGKPLGSSAGATVGGKDLVEKANDAIRKQIEALKLQRVELEHGSLAALEYSLAQGEMAKASPALKAQLIALTQTVASLRIEQEVAAETQAAAAAELDEIMKREKALAEATEDANATIREQNLLFVDAGRFADDLREEVDGMIAGTKELLQWERERIALMVKLKELSPHEGAKQESEALNAAIASLKQYKAESLSAYGSEAQVVKDVDREVLKLTADQKTLTDEMLTFGGAVKTAFDGVLDIFSLFGIKVGKFILMLRELPRVLSGFEKLGKGLSGIFSMLSGSGQGSRASGLFSMLGNFGLLSSFMGMGGSNPAAAALQKNMATQGGMASGVGTAGATGGMSGIMGMLGPAALSAGIGFTLGKMLFGKSGGIGAGLGAGIGSIFGPAGSIIGGLGGGLLGKIFGGLFGSTPKGKLKARILPFDLDALTSGGLRDLDTAVAGTRVGAIGVNVKGNVYKASKEHKLEEEFARALNDLFIDMVKGIKTLIPKLPKMVGAELDAALEGLAETGLQFEKFSKSGSKAKKKLKAHLENLPNAMIEAVVEELGFGKLDLKLMGGGDAAKGFEGLLDALGGMSAVLKRVTGSADNFTGTLEEFTDKSIEFFEGFRRSGETFTDTVARVNQGFASLFGFMDQLSLDISTSAGAGFEGLVEVYQRSVERIQELADAGLIAVESGASPDEIAAAAQALRDAMQVSEDVLQRIAAGLQALNAAVVTGVDLYADLEVRLHALGGATMSIEELIDAAYRLAVSTHNIGAQISIFEAVLRVVGTDFNSFTAALPRLSSAFNELMAAIRNTASNAEAVTQLQALAQAVVNGAQAVYQGIADAASRARDAAQTASDARIQSLEDERAAIEEAAEEQREANQAQLDALRQWKSIVESTKSQLTDLFNLLAPTHPEASYNEALAQFRSAVSGFGPDSTPESAIQIQELARQVLQLAQGVPGMDLPSLAFQTLAAEVKAALEAVKTVAENQPSEEDLLGQIAAAGTDSSARLAEIDAAIREEQEDLRRTLQSISENEQRQLEVANAQQTAALTLIREHLSIRLLALQAEQEAARAILTAITGNLSFESFLAKTQSDSLLMLGSIRDVLEDYLGSIASGLGFPVPALASGGVVLPRPGGTIVRLAEAGYPEMVTPMRGGATGSNGQQIVFSPQVTIYADKDTDGRKVGKAFVKEIKESMLYGELNSTVQKVAGRR